MLSRTGESDAPFKSDRRRPTEHLLPPQYPCSSRDRTLSLSRAVLAILSAKDVSAAAFSVAKEEGAESFDVQLRKQTTSWQENVESRELESKSHQVSTTEEERTEKVAWKHTVAGRGERGIFKVATHYIITENFAAIRHFSKGAVRHP